MLEGLLYIGLIGSIMIKKDHTEICQPIQKHALEKGDWHTNNEFLEIDIAFILLTQNKNLIAKYSVNMQAFVAGF